MPKTSAWLGYTAIAVSALSALFFPAASASSEVQKTDYNILATKSSASQLMIEINGFKQAKGQTCFSLFESDRGFPTRPENSLLTECVAIQQSPQTLYLNNLKPGRYAVAVLHDANSDRQANRNAFGLPVEGFGFSRNPKIGLKAPRFDEAAIPIKGKQTKIKIRLNYLL